MIITVECIILFQLQQQKIVQDEKRRKKQAQKGHNVSPSETHEFSHYGNPSVVAVSNVHDNKNNSHHQAQSISSPVKNSVGHSDNSGNQSLQPLHALPGNQNGATNGKTPTVKSSVCVIT